MRATLSAALVAALSIGALAGPALAEDTGFIAGQGPDLWRASRLVGVDVFGPDDKKVGDVTDVLVDHDGRAVAVVIGIGGVLGLGRKDVALPYAALHFTDAPRPSAPAAAAGAPGAAAGLPTEPGLTANSAIPVETPAAQGEAPAAKGGPVGTTAGVPGGAVTGQAAAPVPAGQGGAAGTARSTARPDHARIDLTFDQLKAAPAFGFAQ